MICDLRNSNTATVLLDGPSHQHGHRVDRDAAGLGAHGRALLRCGRIFFTLVDRSDSKGQLVLDLETRLTRF